MLAEVIGRDILSGIAKGVGLFLGEVFVGVVEGVDKKRREEDERKEREYQLRVADLNERQERLKEEDEPDDERSDSDEDHSDASPGS